MRHLLGIEQRPLPVVLDPAHELIGHPVRQVQVVGATGMVAGGVLQFQELLDVGVPRLEIHACSTLAPAALVHRRHRRVERLEPRHDAVRQAIGAADQRAARPHPVPAHPDAAGELRQLGDVGIAVVDAFERIGGAVEQVARRHLRVSRAGVEQRGRRRQVAQAGDELVERDGFLRRLRQAAGNAEQEVLRVLDDRPALRMPQQVAVVHGAQPEELEVSVALRYDRIVELAGVRRHECHHIRMDEPALAAFGDGLAERVDVLVLDFLVDVGGQQAGSQLRVVRLLRDQRRGRANRQLVELGGCSTVMKTRDGPRRHPHEIDAGQFGGAAFDGADDLVDIDGLHGTVALLHAHPGSVGCVSVMRGVGCRCIGDAHLPAP